MKILGVDPGTICTGFGIILFEKNCFTIVHSGTIRPPVKETLPIRLNFIYAELDKVIKLFDPDEFAIESAFYGKNVQSAMKIGYARGVSMLAAVHNGLATSEYSPREVKKSVVGNGAASKEQVMYMVKKLLSLKKENIKFDESDAIAVAVCHAFKTTSKSTKSGNWKKFIQDNPDRLIQ